MILVPLILWCLIFIPTYLLFREKRVSRKTWTNLFVATLEDDR